MFDDLFDFQRVAVKSSNDDEMSPKIILKAKIQARIGGLRGPLDAAVRGDAIQTNSICIVHQLG